MQKIFCVSDLAGMPPGFLLRVAFVIIIGFTNFVVSPVFSQGRVQVAIDRNATLLNGGQTAQVAVTVKCTPGNAKILEAFVYITQDGIQSNFTPIPVVCSGGPNTYQIRVNTNNGEVLKSGEAHASAYILLSHPSTGRTTSGQASATISLRPEIVKRLKESSMRFLLKEMNDASYTIGKSKK